MQDARHWAAALRETADKTTGRLNVISISVNFGNTTSRPCRVSINTPETQAAIKQILLISRIDVGVLLIVVADMLLKPFS